jgi:hypothetical protein
MDTKGHEKFILVVISPSSSSSSSIRETNSRTRTRRMAHRVPEKFKPKFHLSTNLTGRNVQNVNQNRLHNAASISCQAALHFTNYAIITGVVAATILLAGCGKKNGSSESSTTTPTAQTDVTLSSLPALQPALTAYLHGDRSTVVGNFLAADWSARPLFASGSPLALSEDQIQQIRAVSEADYHAKSREITSQLLTLKALAGTVVEAGFDAEKKGDATQARKCFISARQFGTALDSPSNLPIVQLVGQGYKKMADKEMAKIGQ